MDFENNQQRCFEKLCWCFDHLTIAYQEHQLQAIAELIVQTMTGPWRYFHNPDHIFHVGGTEDPIQVLAALFHDIVYVQVDQSININLSYYVSPYIHEVKEKLFIREDNSGNSSDRTYELVKVIFGFEGNQELSPYAGQNEFLSAIVAAKVLEPMVDLALIAEIVTCIEITIPFRDRSIFDNLRQRLTLASEKFDFKFTPGVITQILQRAVAIANRDVDGFADVPGIFLGNTWSLMPETNHRLDNANIYTVRDYRIAMEKMTGFLRFLKPESIFHQFAGVPSDERYISLQEKAKYNLILGRRYMGIKLFTIAVIEAIALRLGAEVPIATMMGQMPRPGEKLPRLDDFFPPLQNAYEPETTMEENILSLLELGREAASDYDLKNSPLATYMLKYLGFAAIDDHLKIAEQFFQNKISGEQFLQQCPSELVEIISDCVSQLFVETKKVLRSPYLQSV